MQVKGRLVTLTAIDATDDHPNEHIPGAKETNYTMEDVVGTISADEGEKDEKSYIGYLLYRLTSSVRL